MHRILWILNGKTVISLRKRFLIAKGARRSNIRYILAITPPFAFWGVSPFTTSFNAYWHANEIKRTTKIAIVAIPACLRTTRRWSSFDSKKIINSFSVWYLSLTETNTIDVFYIFYFTYKSDVDSFTHFLNRVSDFSTIAWFISNHFVHFLFLSPVLK